MNAPSWQPILRCNYGLELELDVNGLPSTDWIIAWRRLATATHAHGWSLRDNELGQLAWIRKVQTRPHYAKTIWDAWRPPSSADPAKVAGGLGVLHARVAERLRLLDTGLAIGAAAGFRLAAINALDWALSPQFSNPHDTHGGPWTLAEPGGQTLLERVACRAACASHWPHSGLAAALETRPRLRSLLASVNCPALRR